MANLFHSAEIRWFSDEAEAMETIFRNLPFQNPRHGNDTFPPQPERTDYYLKTGLLSIGIKVREGNHEIKLKSDKNEFVQEIGNIEHWSKWSSSEELNILNTIDNALLADWIAVNKKRFLKVYEVKKDKSVDYTTEFVDDGCGVEFTKLTVDGDTYYSFGMEAFCTFNSGVDNLAATWNALGLKRSLFRGLRCMSYPEFLIAVFSGTF